MITTLILTSLLVRQSADAWDIKPNYTVGKKVTYDAQIKAESRGENHDAALQLVLTPGEAIEGGLHKTTIAWEKLELDGNAMDIPVSYTLAVGADGVVRDKTGTDEDSVRRWAAVFSFPYPDKPVKVGDKWTVDVTPKAKDAGKITYACEAKEAGKVGDQDVLKVTCTETEAGDGGMKNSASWSVAKDGSILEFKLTVENWVVPFAGPNAVNGTITGKLVPEKK